MFNIREDKIGGVHQSMCNNMFMSDIFKFNDIFFFMSLTNVTFTTSAVDLIL